MSSKERKYFRRAATAAKKKATDLIEILKSRKVYVTEEEFSNGFFPWQTKPIGKHFSA